MANSSPIVHWEIGDAGPSTGELPFGSRDSSTLTSVVSVAIRGSLVPRHDLLINMSSWPRSQARIVDLRCSYLGTLGTLPSTVYVKA